MKFNSKRGRPKTFVQEKDLGTIELQAKRKNNQTIEPLDAILHKKLINELEYEAGCKLRWLYSLKFGIPNISAHNLGYISGKEENIIDLKWLSIKEKQFNQAVSLLISMNAYQIVSNICIFLKQPSFLNNLHQKSNNIEKNFEDFNLFKTGLYHLSQFFRQKNNFEKLDS
ncbi:MAG: hypothetical protein ACK4OM_05375 [Alphaproteobacteria bacterium]